MQREPHLTWLLGQETTQLPATQRSRVVQLAPTPLPGVPSQRPAAPQCVGSLLGSVQAPPQAMSGDPQDAPQLPLEHTVPAPQEFPGVPGAPPTAQSPLAPQ